MPDQRVAAQFAADDAASEARARIADDFDALVDAWFVETFHNVPDLRVEHFNRFSDAVDQLKARLRAQKG